MIKENTFSLQRFIEEYIGDRKAFDYNIEANTDSFYIVKEKNSKGVQLFLKELYSNCGREIPQVLCIAATGASGKSALAVYICREEVPDI